MLVDYATKELEKLGLKLKIYETVESDKAEGTILEMSPEANKTAKKGDVINVKVAGASKKVTVPDLRDREINYIKPLISWEKPCALKLQMRRLWLYGLKECSKAKENR